MMEIDDDAVFIYAMHKNKMVSVKELKTLNDYGYLGREVYDVESVFNMTMAKLMKTLDYDNATVFEDTINLWKEGKIVATLNVVDTLLVIYTETSNVNADDIKKIVEGVMA